MPSTSITDTVDKHLSKSRLLAETVMELGQVRGMVTRNRSASWVANIHMGVTERREQALADVAELAAQAQELEADCEALRVELHMMEVALKYLHPAFRGDD